LIRYGLVRRALSRCRLVCHGLVRCGLPHYNPACQSLSRFIRGPEADPNHPAKGIAGVTRREAVHPERRKGRRQFRKGDEGFPAFKTGRQRGVPPARRGIFPGDIPGPGQGNGSKTGFI
jgi:hypothetical protein